MMYPQRINHGFEACIAALSDDWSSARIVMEPVFLNFFTFENFDFHRFFLHFSNLLILVYVYKETENVNESPDIIEEELLNHLIRGDNIKEIKLKLGSPI